MISNQFTNQQFCYWLQGYFEIAHTPYLSEKRLIKIEQQLEKINEPLGLYTSWLKQVIALLKSDQYRQSLIDYFFPLIMYELNHLFEHHIDNTYESTHSFDFLLKIHHGQVSLKEKNHDE